MVTKALKQRAIYVYLPSEEQKERWLNFSEKAGVSISKFVIETVENSLRQEEEPDFRSRSELWKENKYPFDIYANIRKGNFVKRFGLQVKRPGISKQEIYWNLDSNQHIQMQKFPWIWYSLPDFLSRSYYKVACVHTLFVNPNFFFLPLLYKSKMRFYLRLGAFANGIITCAIGERIDNIVKWWRSEEIFKEFEPVKQIHTYLDFTDRKAQLFTNIKTETDESN